MHRAIVLRQLFAGPTRPRRCSSDPGATQQPVVGVSAACDANAPAVNALLDRVRFHQGQGDHVRWRATAQAARTVAAMREPLRPGSLPRMPGVGRVTSRTVDEALRIQNARAHGGVAQSAAATARDALRRNRRRGRASPSKAAELADAVDGDATAYESNAGVALEPAPDDPPFVAKARELLASGASIELDDDGDDRKPRVDTTMATTLLDADTADAIVTALRRHVRSMAPDALVEAVGPQRRGAALVRRIHVVVTVPGSRTYAAESGHDDRHLVLLDRVVSSGLASGLFAPSVTRDGLRKRVLRVRLDLSESAQQKRPAENDDDVALQKVTVEWSAFDRFWARVLCLTGPTAHVAGIQETASSAGLALSAKDGLVTTASAAGGGGLPPGTVVRCDSEDDVYRACGAAWTPPAFRAHGVATRVFDGLWRV